MNFYLKSPYGNLNLDNLERCLKTRVLYFMQKKQDHTNQSSPNLNNFVMKNSDCLAIGSSYDMVGHYMLRLLVVYSSQMHDFLLDNELELFQERFTEKIQTSSFIKSCRITLRHIEAVLNLQDADISQDKMTLENVPNLPGKRRRLVTAAISPCDSYVMYLTSLQLFCKSLRIPQVAQHFLQNCSSECTTYHISVPFQTCLNLVSKRQIHMHQGKANIYCSLWKEAVQEIFEFILTYNIRSLRNNMYASNYLQDDVRMINLFKEMKHLYLKYRSNEGYLDSNEQTVPRINADQVERESVYFPPCISNVHKILKRIHRLKHNDRFYYSLFLKSIGMSLNESILFWKTEYSKVSCCTSVCSHSWQKNERKYTYGIRHLYGLEGSRKKYGPPDCGAIQGIHQANLDHTCPFLYQSQDNLVQSLSPNVTPSQLSAILHYRHTHSPLESCRFYLSQLSGVTESPGFESPNGYYFAMKSFQGPSSRISSERESGAECSRLELGIKCGIIYWRIFTHQFNEYLIFMR